MEDQPDTRPLPTCTQENRNTEEACTVGVEPTVSVLEQAKAFIPLERDVTVIGNVLSFFA
jgi:hypothetical protein